ncbi:hypothetical protein JXJ21_13510 [candidate division KSB1 bacterium]|nr:hypothetical protein [candidate division KSB1 bacterium]
MNHAHAGKASKPDGETKLISFSNQTRQDKKLLKTFVDFHWKHYEDHPQYVPLLDYEYLGFKLLGIKGFFEPRNLFFKHTDMQFFLALNGDEVVGRCNAFVNHNHNRHWHDKVGFFGQFESIDDQQVAAALLNAAADWLKSQGMEFMRGPQNLPVNEATPGLLTEGFDSRPVMYYHYNKPYYENLLLAEKFEPVKRVCSWEVPVMNPMEERLVRVAQKVIDRFDLKIETWGERPLKVRKQEMFEIYNDAWNDNFGFVPFTQEEFYSIIDDMLLIMDKGLFLFIYLKGETAAFFGGVPNITERMVPFTGCRRCELLRAAKMLLTKGKVKGFRLGYLGVKKKFQRLGLDGVMLWQQKIYAQKHGYDYCDMGWVLEDNVRVTRLVEMMGSVPSKIYTIYQKPV